MIIAFHSHLSSFHPLFCIIVSIFRMLADVYLLGCKRTAVTFISGCKVLSSSHCSNTLYMITIKFPGFLDAQIDLTGKFHG